MNCSDSQDAMKSIESLRCEINRLIREQLDAYKSATFLGMTSPEAEKCVLGESALENSQKSCGRGELPLTTSTFNPTRRV